MVVSNLVCNVCSYIDEGCIDVYVFNDWVVVCDIGIGMFVEVLLCVFELFYCVELSCL